MKKLFFRPILSQFVDRFTVLISRFRFTESSAYWESRYRFQGSSGAGSYGEHARKKAEFLNAFCREHQIADVLEFGCGDGAQLELACYKDYIGLDVSQTAIKRCRRRFESNPTRKFYQLEEFRGATADLVLSLDVLFHLVEDSVFLRHLDSVFGSAQRFVVIFSTNHMDPPDRRATHVRHRAFTAICASRFPEFELFERPEQESSENDVRAGFYVFRRINST